MVEQLKWEERALLRLRQLYSSYGYEPFKMSKFEPYDLYLNHKEFLISEGAITFTDTDGTLMALKPDVTLSIVKNFRREQTPVQKVYYNENVYRISGASRRYREIMQTGIECLGEVAMPELCEMVVLAAKSLQSISQNYVLDLSHLGIIAEILNPLSLSQEERAEALQMLGQKNLDALRQLLAPLGEAANPLMTLTALSGQLDEVLPALRPLCRTSRAEKAYEELQLLSSILKDEGLENQVRLDFSIVNDMNYYNGLVFRGYVAGIPTGVLSGGQYDQLMEKMGKDARGVGFAVYLDQLERLPTEEAPYDLDTVLLYSSDDAAASFRAAEALRKDGTQVLLAQQPPAGKRVRRLLCLVNGEVTEVG